MRLRICDSSIDHVLVPDSAVGFCSGNHIQRFQNIGLSLRVFSVEDVGTLGKIHVQGNYISEIRQFKTAYIHKFFSSVRQFIRAL